MKKENFNKASDKFNALKEKEKAIRDIERRIDNLMRTIERFDEFLKEKYVDAIRIFKMSLISSGRIASSVQSIYK